MGLCAHGDDENNCLICEAVESSQANGDVECICGSGARPKTLMTCTGCNKTWHSGCVGLSGLTQSLTAKIEAWKCPLCFSFSQQIKEKLGDLPTNGTTTNEKDSTASVTVSVVLSRRMNTEGDDFRLYIKEKVLV